MKNFLKYVLATITGIILLGIVLAIISVISMVGLAASSASNTKVEENSVFTLMLSGTLDERAAEDPIGMLTGQVSENLGLDNIISAIKKAKDNEDVKGIYIEAGAFSSDTPASSHAIREALLGQPVFRHRLARHRRVVGVQYAPRLRLGVADQDIPGFDQVKPPRDLLVAHPEPGRVDRHDQRPVGRIARACRSGQTDADELPGEACDRVRGNVVHDAGHAQQQPVGEVQKK